MAIVLKLELKWNPEMEDLESEANKPFVAELKNSVSVIVIVCYIYTYIYNYIMLLMCSFTMSNIYVICRYST